MSVYMMRFDIARPMKRWPCLFALAILLTSIAPSASPETVTYSVQLVRGNDEGSSPMPGTRRIGPRISKSLHSVFRWKNYWEVCRQKVVVPTGTKTSVILSKERTVEIDLSRPKKRKVTAISHHEPICSTTQAMGEAMTVIGADRDPTSAWFVVVRRDKPATD